MEELVSEEILKSVNEKFEKAVSEIKDAPAEDNFFDELYAEFDIQRITAVRMINSKSEKRGNVTELLIKNY